MATARYRIAHTLAMRYRAIAHKIYLASWCIVLYDAISLNEPDRKMKTELVVVIALFALFVVYFVQLAYIIS